MVPSGVAAERVQMLRHIFEADKTGVFPQLLTVDPWIGWFITAIDKEVCCVMPYAVAVGMEEKRQSNQDRLVR